MKRKFAAGLAAAALLLAGCSRTVTIAPRAEELNTALPPPVSVAMEPEETPAEHLFSFSFLAGEERLALPVTYQELMDQGWSSGILPQERLLGHTMVTGVVFTKGELSFAGILANQTDRQAPIPEADLVYVTLNQPGFTLPGDIVVGQSTDKDVEAAYGQPNERIDSTEGPARTRWLYEYDRNEYVQLTIVEETHLLQEATLYRAEDIPPYTQPPQVVAQYTPATQLSDSMADQTFAVDGAVYKMPVPIALFVENGWTLAHWEESVETPAGETILPSNSAQDFLLTKGEQELQVVVCNYALEERPANQGYVTDLFIIADAAQGVTVAPGMTFATTKEEAQALCGDYPYCYKEEDGLDIYWIYVSDYGYVSPVFDGETKELAYFQLFCVP